MTEVSRLTEGATMAEVSGDQTSVRRLLQGTLDTLSNSERKVARALLAQYPSAGLTTIVDLAGAAGVSPPTVLRLVTRLGFSGFPAFQRALVHELNAAQGSPLKQYSAKMAASPHGVLADSHEAFADMLAGTYADLPESEFRALSELLADPARRVRVTGGRFSRLVAEYLVLHLRLLRSDAHLVGVDDLDRNTSVLDTDASTVLVVYDVRRYSDRSLEFAEGMAARGATVCLMTDNWLSPIAKIAKVVLPVQVESAASPFDSLVASMAITEALVAAIAELCGDAGVERLRFLEESAET